MITRPSDDEVRAAELVLLRARLAELEQLAALKAELAALRGDGDT